MHRNIKQSIVFSVIAALILISFGTTEAFSQDPLAADQPDGIKMTVDILLVRPLGIASTALGSALYIVSFPFQLLGGDTSTPWEKLVVEPARFTFGRPLGKF